jgi:glycosyltransferase involved in cell wall biosynthesis
LYVQYTNPAGYPPLEHSSRILAQRGWQVLFLGTGAKGAADAFEFPPHPRIRARRLRFVRPGWKQKLQFLWFHVWTLYAAALWRPQWIYVSDLMACPFGLLSTLCPGVRVLYHEHDSPDPAVQNCASEYGTVGQQLNTSPSERVCPPLLGVNHSLSLANRLLLWTRLRLARRAVTCVLPNHRRIEAFRQTTKTSRPVLCVWNCPSKDEIAPLCESPAAHEFVVFYHGSIVPARLPLTLIRAMALLPSTVVLRVFGYETDPGLAHLDRLRAESRQLGIEHRFQYRGALRTRNELLQHCRSAHVGLAFMPSNGSDLNERAMAGASNKPFDYLACGLPLLVSDLPDWHALFVAPGHGLACKPESPESIAGALRWFLENPDQRHKMGFRGWQRIQSEWNYETQFAGALEVLESQR